MNDLKPAQFTKSKQNFILGRCLLIVPIIMILIAVFLIWSSLQNTSSVLEFVTNRGQTLKTEEGRVNILLLGIAGETHDGANLTDTIILASYDLQTHQVDLISLPRDLWIEKYKAKVNTLYQLGLSKDKDLDFASSEIGEVLGISIPYTIRVNFAGFTKAIDMVGGIDVSVEHAFDDYLYPLEGQETNLCDYQEKQMDLTEDQAKKLNLSGGNYKVLIGEDGQIATASAQVSAPYSINEVIKYFPCRFEHLSFDAGMTHMDGKTALKFVRSREGTSGEGSDFARSRRQQKVLLAFKNKVLSLETLADPQKVISLIQTFGGSVDTNIPQTQFLRFIQMIKDTQSIKSHVVDASGTKSLLITPSANIYGAWVLVPAEGNYDRIHQFVDDILAK